MTTLLIDSSVWLAAAREDDEPQHTAATELMRRRSRRELELRLLDLTTYELGNVIICKWRFGPERAEGIVERALRLAGTAPLVPTRDERRSALGLAEQHGLSVYDATYAAVAQARRLRLVSGDRRLQDAGLAVAPAAA